MLGEEFVDFIKKTMLDKRVKSQIKTTVKKYLPSEDYKLFIFGSRATGENRRFSDLDLGILGPKIMPSHVKVKIEEELENSRIPYKIDVVDFKKVSDEFRKLALRETVDL